MSRSKAGGAAAAVVVTLAAAIAGSARGAAEPGTYPFYDCVGPSGTPTSFTATKENLPAAEGGTASAGVAYLLTDGSGVFVVQQFGSASIGQGIPSGNTVVSCKIDFPPPTGTFTFSGFLVPRG